MELQLLELTCFADEPEGVCWASVPLWWANMISSVNEPDLASVLNMDSERHLSRLMGWCSAFEMLDVGFSVWQPAFAVSSSILAPGVISLAWLKSNPFAWVQHRPIRLNRECWSLDLLIFSFLAVADSSFAWRFARTAACSRLHWDFSSSAVRCTYSQAIGFPVDSIDSRVHRMLLEASVMKKMCTNFSDFDRLVSLELLLFWPIFRAAMWHVALLEPSASTNNQLVLVWC